VVQIAAFFTVVLVNMRFHDRIDRAALFTETTENTLGQIDVITRGAAGAVLALCRFDRDGHGGTYGLAQFARDATLFAVFVATQSVQTAKTWRSGRGFNGITQGYLALEEILPRQAHAFEHLRQHQTAKEIFDCFHNLAP